MRILYFASHCGGFNIVEMPNGAIFLHHLLQDMLIGPLESVDEARCFIALQPSSSTQH